MASSSSVYPSNLTSNTPLSINLNLEQIHSSSTSSDSLCSLTTGLLHMCFPWLKCSSMFFNSLHLLTSFLPQTQVRNHFLKKSSGSSVWVGSHWYRLSENQISLLCTTDGIYNSIFINVIICLIFVLPSPINCRFHTHLLLNILFLFFLIASSVCI